MIKIIFDKSVNRILEKLKNSTKSEDKKLFVEILKTIEILKEYGDKLNMPHSKNLKGYKGLKELRIFTPDIGYRIFYFIHKNIIGVMLSGVEKKSNKLNPKIIQNASKKMKEYIKYIEEKGVDEND